MGRQARKQRRRDKPADRVAATVAAVRSRPLFALMIVVGTAVVGIATFTDALGSLWHAAQAVLPPAEEDPGSSLSVLGFYADSGSGDPTSAADVYALAEGTLASTYSVFRERDWMSLGGARRYDRDSTRFRAKAMRLLPGILVFVLQNTGGTEDPTVIVRGLGLEVDVASAMSPLGDDDLALIYNHVPYAGIPVPATRGTVALGPSRQLHPVQFPDTRNRFLIYRDTLAPGGETLYAVDLDVTDEGVMDLSRVRLVVDYQYVTRRATRRGRVVVAPFLQGLAVKPRLEQVAELYWDYESELDGPTVRPDIAASDIWKYGGNDLPWGVEPGASDTLSGPAGR